MVKGTKVIATNHGFYMNPVCGYHTTIGKEYEVIEVKTIPAMNIHGYNLEENEIYSVMGDLGVVLMIEVGDENNFKIVG